MRVLRSAVITLLVGISAPGCARHQPAPDPTPQSATVEPPSPVEDLVLEVENHNWSDIIVYISHDGVSSRFAQITAGASTSLPIPPHLVGPTGVFRLSVRRIGGTDNYASEPVSVRTGSVVRLTVESRLARSSVAVW